VTHYDVVVIGGGISGVARASCLAAQGKKVLILEKNSKVGGSIYTYYSSKAKGYWIEMGAHAIYNSYRETLQLIEEFNLSSKITKRKKLKFMLYDDKGFSSILYKLNFLRMGFGLLKLRLLSKKGQTVSKYYAKVFGDANFKNVLRYAFDGVLSQDSSDFPAELLFKSYKKNKYYPRSFTFEQGLSVLVDTLVRELKCDLSINAKVDYIERRGASWLVSSSEGLVQCNEIVLATPPREAARILDSGGILGAYQNTFDLIGESKVDSVGVILKQEMSQHIPEIAGCVGVEQAFYSMVSRDVVFNKEYRGFVFHFKGGGSLELDDYIESIKGYLSICDESIIDTVCCRNSLPMTNPEFIGKSLHLREHFEKISISLVGSYFSRLSIEDCVSQGRGINNA
jgi:protoporphyrinogen/coproporphyrinogen III oxidase